MLHGRQIKSACIHAARSQVSVARSLVEIAESESSLHYGHAVAQILLKVSMQDWEAVVEYLMQRGEAERALPVLRRPGVSQELWYKFAPTLMLLAPRPTVDAWMTAQPPLDPPRCALIACRKVAKVVCHICLLTHMLSARTTRFLPKASAGASVGLSALLHANACKQFPAKHFYLSKNKRGVATSAGQKCISELF